MRLLPAGTVYGIELWTLVLKELDSLSVCSPRCAAHFLVIVSARCVIAEYHFNRIIFDYLNNVHLDSVYTEEAVSTSQSIWTFASRVGTLCHCHSSFYLCPLTLIVCLFPLTL